MKKTNLKNIIFMAGLTLLSGACEKQLEQNNPNAQTSATFWQSQDDALKGINAAYLTLAVDGGYMRSTNLLLDNRGDDLKSNSPWDQMYNSGKFALNAGNDAIYGWAYGGYYEGISKANLVIDNVPAITMDAELKKRVLGQAYFLRGLYFFHLVNMYGNVSLPTNSVKTKADFTVPQSTTEQGWSQVIEDLKKAADMLPTSYDGVTGSDKDKRAEPQKPLQLGI